MDNDQLDSVIHAALATPGFAIISNNPRRLMVMLRNRLGVLGVNNPGTPSAIALMASKSPREFYILNRRRKDAPDGADKATPGGDTA